MADAQIHQLNLKIIGLEETIAIHTACATALKQQLAQKQQECDEHVENLSRCKGNELAEQLAQAQAEIEDWRKKKKGKP